VKQWPGTGRYVPTSAVHPALYIETESDSSLATYRYMNKDKFHNQLALNLGYQCIVNDKCINISIDDKQYPDDVRVSISVDGFSSPMCFMASERLSQNDINFLNENGYETIKMIVDAVHQAYLEATRNPF